MSALTRIWVPLLLVTAGVRGQESGGAPAEGLTRVTPNEEAFGSARDEVRADWRERLLDTDLVRREESFGKLIETVRRNPSLAGVLREWAVDRRRPELAWSARLALRELSRQPSFGFHGHLVPSPPPASKPGPEALPLAGGDAFAETLSLSQGPGGVTIRVVTTTGGESRTRTFEGTTLAELLEANPELAEKLEVSRGKRPPTHPPDRPDWWATPSFDRPQPWTFGPELRTDVLGAVVREATTAERHRFGLAQGGLTVERVVEDTIAEVLGLRAGSLVVEINGRAIDAKDDIPAVLSERPPSGALRLTLIDAFGRRRTRTWEPAPVAAARPGPAREE